MIQRYEINILKQGDFLAREAQMAQQLGVDINEQNNARPLGGPVDMGDFLGSSPGNNSGFLETQQQPSSNNVNGNISSNKQNTFSSVDEPESEKLKKWKTDQVQLLAKKDAEAAERQKEQIERAKKEIQKFYEEYKEKKQKQIAKNREDQKLNEATVSSAKNVWERVCAAVDFGVQKPKTVVKSKTADASVDKEDKRDTSRMKSLLLTLKSDIKSPGN
jgi:hypothetical protein